MSDILSYKEMEEFGDVKISLDTMLSDLIKMVSSINQLIKMEKMIRCKT